MIVIAIVGILAAIAWPSYQSSIQRGYRTKAIGFLQDIESRQVKFVGEAARFATNFNELGIGSGTSINIADDRYQLVMTVDADGKTYSLLATPQNSQLDDPCKKISLDHLGQKKVVDALVDASRCWGE